MTTIIEIPLSKSCGRSLSIIPVGNSGISLTVAARQALSAQRKVAVPEEEEEELEVEVEGGEGVVATMLQSVKGKEVVRSVEQEQEQDPAMPQPRNMQEVACVDNEEGQQEQGSQEHQVSGEGASDNESMNAEKEETMMRKKQQLRRLLDRFKRAEAQNARDAAEARNLPEEVSEQMDVDGATRNCRGRAEREGERNEEQGGESPAHGGGDGESGGKGEGEGEGDDAEADVQRRKEEKKKEKARQKEDARTEKKRLKEEKKMETKRLKEKKQREEKEAKAKEREERLKRDLDQKKAGAQAKAKTKAKARAKGKNGFSSSRGIFHLLPGVRT